MEHPWPSIVGRRLIFKDTRYNIGICCTVGALNLAKWLSFGIGHLKFGNFRKIHQIVKLKPRQSFLLYGMHYATYLHAAGLV